MGQSKQNKYLYTALMGVFLFTSFTSIYGLKTINIIHSSATSSLILSSYVSFITCTAVGLTLLVYDVLKVNQHKNHSVISKEATHSNTLKVVEKSHYIESTPSLDSGCPDEKDLDIDLIQLSEPISSTTSSVHEETSSVPQIKLRQPLNSTMEDISKNIQPSLIRPLIPIMIIPPVKNSDSINGISPTTSPQPQHIPVPPAIPTELVRPQMNNDLKGALESFNRCNLKSVKSQNTGDQNKSTTSAPSAISEKSSLGLSLTVKKDETTNQSDQLQNRTVPVIPPAFPPTPLSPKDKESFNMFQIKQEQSFDNKPSNSDSKVENVEENILSGLVSSSTPVQSQNTSDDRNKSTTISEEPLSGKKPKKSFLQKARNILTGSKKTKEDSSATVAPISPSISEESLSTSQQLLEYKSDGKNSKAENVEVIMQGNNSPTTSSQLQENENAISAPPPPPMPIKPSSVSQQPSEAAFLRAQHLNAIQEGIKLKKVDAPLPCINSRDSLLKEIRVGVKLKKVESSSPQDSVKPTNDNNQNKDLELVKALSDRIRQNNYSDNESDHDEGEWENKIPEGTLFNLDYSKEVNYEKGRG